ncbi:hypothetical protein Nepgr_018792 [Nepenthes gracilis]|uniref:Uncharacterized protein n=1 Tax=Nepenthes gracilis TaxID=150966 RepID=A0AAD3XUN6_NEPGR|nr:hypothetical protein Nepgr_018792 [Nepenthes gracilis]
MHTSICADQTKIHSYNVAACWGIPSKMLTGTFICTDKVTKSVSSPKLAFCFIEGIVHSGNFQAKENWAKSSYGPNWTIQVISPFQQTILVTTCITAIHTKLVNLCISGSGSIFVSRSFVANNALFSSAVASRHFADSLVKSTYLRYFSSRLFA